MAYTKKQYKQRISLGQNGNALVMLIAISLIMFVLFGFLKMVWYFRYEDKQLALSLFNKNVLNWFTLPADLNQLAHQPWSIITFMFLQVGVWPVLTNMLWLWCFGFIMQELTGNKKIIPVFIYGSLAGAIAFILAYNLSPSLQALVPFAATMGASAGVMAVAVSTTMVAPGYRIFPMIYGGFSLWILTLIYIVIDLSVVFNDTGNFMAHLAGAFAGYLFMFFLRKGYDGSEWMNKFFDWVNNLFNPDKPRKGKSVKDMLHYKSSKPPYKKTPNITQQRIDDILDKINQKGYNFLTDEEKELLRKASQEDLK
ncbi:MAG: rhomboid family intramembrane serine protease [Bacteroidia bacterium]|nr:rhomboid family intramembrane serine protease [Bacteroidia bacterium]